MLTEIRMWTGRWRISTLYDANRSELPAARRPSEYWRTNCLAGASFVHKAEVEMRHELGVETILFGRDYPHPEEPGRTRGSGYGTPSETCRPTNSV